MLELLCFVLAILAAPFKSRRRLEAENAVFRHQLIVLRRKEPSRVRLTNGDRWFLVQLYGLFPWILQTLTIIGPETLVRWHRAGFRNYWRWKSGSRGGRPKIESDLRALIRRMSMENPLWGAPRIHGELGPWIKIHRSLAPFSGPEAFCHTRSLADFITTTFGFRFSVQTGLQPQSSIATHWPGPCVIMVTNPAWRLRMSARSAGVATSRSASPSTRSA